MYNYENEYTSARKEIWRLHGVCMQYREEAEELKRIIRELILLLNETKGEKEDPSEWLLEQIDLDEDLYKEIMKQE